MTRSTVVLAGIEDVERLAEMQATCFDEPWGSASIAKTLSLPGAFAMVLRDTTPAGRISAGFAIVQVVTDQADLLTLGVVPGLRRRGYGKRLLAAALAEATKRGAKLVFLEVAENNLGGVALYRRAGFETMGRREGYYRDREGRRVAAVTMRREI
ncbi:MAG: GNAT family N-acetyltransferase [Alphaproteobacteria bacterium]|nr:GNAT family N-acetyltransferase [Alphaproteobacteria bacterium]